jgi:hypothetical protein
MPLTKGIDHLCYSLRPAIVQAKLAQEIFYLWINYRPEAEVDSGCSLSRLVYPNCLVQARWRALYGLNPMAGVIEGFRWAFTGQGRPPDLMYLTSVWAVLIVVDELVYFNKAESTIASVV